MIKKSLLLTLLLALLVPWAAQAQETLTVCNGTETNEYLPVYGYYVDTQGTTSEFIIPANTEGMSDMEGGTISKLTFYISGSPASWGNPTIQLYLGEVEYTTLSSVNGPSNFTVVKTMEWSNQQSTIEVEFDVPYTYGGGNLLIGTYVASRGSYKHTDFFGVSAPSGSGYCHYSYSNASQSFLPKTTFTYEAAASDCPKPNNLVASNVTAHTADLSWESDGIEFILQYKKASDSIWNEESLYPEELDFPYMLTNLAAETEYQVRVAAFHETCPTDPETGDHVHSDWRETSFTTGIACFAPTNLAVTPESITAREATVTWEGTSDSYVVMIGEENFAVSADFETGDLSQADFTTTSSYPWTVVANSHSGAYCAKSGNELQNSTTSYLYLEVNLTADMTLTFSAKVSSESGYDKAYFDIDGVNKINGISGNGNWIDYSYPLTAGTHTLRWYYTKDTSTASYDDCFYVDDIVVSAGVASWTDYNANALTYSFTNLTPNRSYLVKVKGNCGDEGYSQETTPVSFTTLPSCFAPTGLAMVAGYPTAHGASFTWDYQTGEVFQYALVQGNVTDPSEVNFNTTWNAGDNFPMWNTLSADTDWSFFLRKNCDGDFSDPVYVNFHTLEACPAPTGFAVMPNSITGHTANLTWQGTSNSYQVAYRTTAYVDGTEEGFSANPNGWLFRTGALNADGTATLSGNTSWNRYTSNGVFDTHIYMNMYSTKNYWLITPSMEIKDGDALSLDMAYTAYSGTQAAPKPNCPTHRFAVLISTDDMQHWTILREWNNSGSEYVLDAIPTSGQNSGNIDLSAYAGQTAYIAFFGHSETSDYDNNFHFDNVAIGTPVPAGEMQYATNITEETVTLQGLLAETEYEAWLQGDCGSEGPSTEVGPITFTTDVACPAPTGLAATEISGYTAKLNWTGYSESYTVYYRAAIYKAANLAGEWETVSVDEPPCILAGLTPETTYEAKVQGDCGDDGLSLETYITFTTDVACPASTGLAVSNITGHEATINWTSAAEAWQICVNDDEENLIDVTENTYTLTGLTPETAYTVKVRANCGDDGYSDWTTVNFTTDVACPAPTGFAVAENGLTGHTATLNWQGTSNEYQVSYRTAAYMDGIEEGFNSDPEGWSYKTGALNADGTATLIGNPSWSRGTRNGVFDTHIYMNMYSSSSKDYWLITSSMEIQNGYALSFDMAYTAYNGTQATPALNSPTHRFAVLISTDDMQHWTILREWNNSGSEYVLDQVSTSGENSGNIDLSAYVGQTAYIAFFGHAEVTNYDNNFHFDNVAIGTPVPAGEMQYATNITEETVTLQGLLAETEYEAWLQGDCGSEGLSTEVGPITFTTLGLIIWNNPEDWPNDSVPEAYSDVTIPANTLVIIPDGCIARPSNITFEENGSLTIEPGGQLVHDQDSVVATVVMDIIGYGDGLKNNYYLIASPLRDPISPMAVENMTNNVFDLYKFDQSNHNDENEYLEWVNYHGLINGSYPLVNTEGYLYANSDDVMPRFTGEVRRSDENVEVGLIYDDDIRVRFNGWNLVGNPFVCNAFVLTEQGQTVDFYEIVGDSLSLTTNNEIAPCQGIFVQAESDVQTVTFSRTAPAKRSGVLNMNLTQGRAKVDMARIRFGEGRNLGRLSFNDNSSKLYIPMDGKDYAVVYSEGMGEMPVSFKAEYNGTYTLGFSNSEVSFSYLHLIDNMTGADVDLLQTPNYSFEASTTDYASRFKLVFCTGNAMEDNFAFYSNGNFVINNEGEATLQVIDVTGRIVKSESINGSASVNVNAAAGVYMLRLINGNDVKVQKIVVK